LKSGDEVRFGEQTGTFLHNPGHTSGAITFVFGKTAFTGDTLFAAGCGRLFEGTPEQMHDSLNIQIGGLPDDTELYFGHEYTAANLRFALSVETGNTEINKKLAAVRLCVHPVNFPLPRLWQRSAGQIRLCAAPQPKFAQPLRPGNPDIILSEKEVFRTLRELKNNF